MSTTSVYSAIFADFRADAASDVPEIVQKAIFMAARLQARAAELQAPAERRQQAELDRMLQHPEDKATLTEITDQAFRSNTAYRAVDQFIHILDVQGIPRFFSPFQRTLLKGFQSFGGYAPGVAVPLVKDQMRKETANVILPAEPELLLQHLRARHTEGVRMNVNFLGEAILGEEEANERLQINLQALQSPDIEVISVKISTLFSQISALAREHTIATLCDRLELLYRAAAHQTFRRADGQVVPKFVYLDMEEYRDMSLTAEAFMRTLDRPGLEKVSAGIALQAYIPDSFAWQQEINRWARQRVAAGGAPITVRLVKGANMEMERAEAAQRGWPQAPYKSKLETDANYARMVDEGMKPENMAAVRLGVASHNLFDLSYAFVQAAEKGLLDKVQFEMLEGMANGQRRALFECTRNMLLYAPVCRKEDFIYAIGYLVRRLDENTGPENFLRHAFRIRPDGPEWQRLAQQFVEARKASPTVSAAARRTQNRQLPPPPSDAVSRGWQHLVNEPDTDFSLPHNSEWAKQVIAAWEPRCGDKATEIPLVVAGEEVFDGGISKGHDPVVDDVSAIRPVLTPGPSPGGRGETLVRECLDPSRPGVVVGRYRSASGEDVQRAVACAMADEDGWRAISPKDRFERLGHVAEELRRARGDLIGAAMADGGKTISESDPEVSEAVDFVEFYRSTALWWQERPTLQSRPKGVVVVVSPWNFPIAIPCGGAAAALAAGNTVILKPASDTVLTAWELCKCFWRGGVSRKTLQFLPCDGNHIAQQLVNHPGVNAVILTGGTATAQKILRDKPSLHLLAETGGKNAAIVTAMADRDQAIKHVIHSAFSHSGQKCSATSLLLLEAEVYDDPKFKHALCDAVSSLRVGSAWRPETKMGPLIRPPSGDLENSLKVLEPGESWAVLPRQLENNPSLWSPGVKYGVQPGSYTHMTEFFGPMLGVMRFEKLAEAIELVNQTGYGLTSGLQSLDDREQKQWQSRIRAGNLYINRTTVGAIVLRQPFGGMGKSVFGPGMKAGGPNYVALLMNFEDLPARKDCSDVGEGGGEEPSIPFPISPLLTFFSPDSLDRPQLLRAAESYATSFREEFGITHDHFKLVGQDNFRRYLPVRELRICVHPQDSLLSILLRLCAARIVGCRTTVSAPQDCHRAALQRLEELTEPWAGAVEFVEETDAELAAVIRAHQTDRIRFAAPDRVAFVVQEAAAETGLYLATEPVLLEGRHALLWYVQEQSLSFDYHRYGNLGVRDREPRAPVL